MVNISDTAFLVNESRSRSKDLSQDTYAEHWISPDRREEVGKLWDSYSKEVYSFDDIVLGIRNRFYLNIIKKFIEDNPMGNVINIGAGLTSYPWLIDRKISYSEFDLEGISTYRSERIRKLTDEGVLSSKTVNQYITDLNDEKLLEELFSVLIHTQKVDCIPSLIILEGVSYYIRKECLFSLFQFIARYQVNGSVLCFDYWLPEIINHPVFIRQEAFFEKRFGFEKTKYTLIRPEMLTGFEEYIINTTSIVELEKEYRSSPILCDNWDNVLHENEMVCIKNG